MFAALFRTVFISDLVLPALTASIQECVHSPPCVLHQFRQVSVVIIRDGNRLMNDHRRTAGGQIQAAFRQNVSGTVDGDGKNGYAEVNGHLKGAFLKLFHLPVDASRSFRKKQNGGSANNFCPGGFDGVYSFVFFLSVRGQPRTKQSRPSAASDVYKRQLHHPFEVYAQPAVKHIDIIHALVIGSDDVRRAGFDVIRSDDVSSSRLRLVFLPEKPNWRSHDEFWPWRL